VSAKYFPEFDWIDLRAYGFTYSNPVLRISLKKPVENLSKSSTSSKVKLITCVKGKLIKKVSTKQCPNGYRKK
jgi:hypothetical protein